jgi:hypothetical protein
MSYVITIKANEGGAVLFVEGDLPDGEHIIRGEDDGDVVSTEVERRTALGRYVNRARHHYSRRELAFTMKEPQVLAASDPDS